MSYQRQEVMMYIMYGKLIMVELSSDVHISRCSCCHGLCSLFLFFLYVLSCQARRMVFHLCRKYFNDLLCSDCCVAFFVFIS